MRIEEHFEIVQLPEFKKDMKKLKKKYLTLEDDLRTFIGAQIYLYHKLGKDNQGVFPVSDLGIEEHNVFKAKKFACRSLSGTGVRSGIRVIYSYEHKSNSKDKLTLIEIYYKGDKETEDKDRILKYFG